MAAADPDGVFVASHKPTDYVLMNLWDLTVQLATGETTTKYPRPTEMVEEQRWRKKRMDLLEQQAERNRLRDAEEATDG